MSAEELLTRLSTYFKTKVPDIKEYELTEQDIILVNHLAQTKYDTWNWNFGASPDYDFKRAQTFPFGTVDVRLRIEKGIITSAAFYGDFFGNGDTHQLAEKIVGCRHRFDSLQSKLNLIPIEEYINGISKKDFLFLLL